MFIITSHTVHCMKRGKFASKAKGPLSEDVPKHEHETQANDHADNDGVAPLTKIDFVHQIVDERKFVCQIIQFCLNSLKIHILFLFYTLK